MWPYNSYQPYYPFYPSRYYPWGYNGGYYGGGYNGGGVYNSQIQGVNQNLSNFGNMSGNAGQQTAINNIG